MVGHLVVQPKRNRPRVVNPDGTLNVRRVGVERELLHDLYHLSRRTSWFRLTMGITAAWLILNLVFAGLLFMEEEAIEGARPQSFLDIFYFSVQTFSTIGYGTLGPRTDYAGALVTAEAIVSMLFIALTTGLVFAKFSTPTARVIFARNALITRYDGKRVFMFRMVNKRLSQVLEAQAEVTFIRDWVGHDGERMRRFLDLDLRRSRTPIFALGWTVFHEIDEASPLYGLDAEDLAAINAIFFVVFSGVDDTLAAGVYARHAYDWEDVRWDVQYKDTFKEDETGRTYIDYSMVHEIKEAANTDQRFLTPG